MRLRPEKFQQGNLIKLTPTVNQKIKTKDLKVSQSKPTLCGVTVAVTPLTRLQYFFSPELEQVESQALPSLQVLIAY